MSAGGHGATRHGAPIHINFDDNSLLPLLFGEHDRHLARIEQKLGVSLASRGNRLAINGPHSASEAARGALLALYERLRRGMSIDIGEVDAAVRLAENAESSDTARDLFGGDDLTIRTKKRHVRPRSPNQALYLKALRDFEMVFALGPAGTGKTYLAVATAVEMLSAGRIDRIVLSRPAVEAGERLGFLPGDLREKIDPYLRPLYDALYDVMPGEQVLKRLANGEIEVAPLAFMRGRTLSNAFVIVDEAQNTTAMQMKMLLTRLGENSRMVVTGDLTQIDLPAGQRSGLTDAIATIAGIDGLAVVEFGAEDVVRHHLVARIVEAYDARDRATTATETNRPGDGGG
ncbi:MAG TPA: PhoH family protein [Alphaproteobacteria bacterium]|nr:PhoH family protein [Alphaproteobacteria bacterium]